MKHVFKTLLPLLIVECAIVQACFASFNSPPGQGENQLTDALPAMVANWTLKDAVDFALLHNPSPRITKDQVAARVAEVEVANSYYYPSLTLRSEYSQTDNPMYSFGNILNQGAFDNSIDFNNPGRTDVLALEARIDYRIYDGGRRLAGVEMSQAAEVASLRLSEGVVHNLAFDVVRSFHRIIQAQEMAVVRKAEISAISASLMVGQARFEAGDLLQEDLLNLELQKERATENHIRSVHNLRLAKRQFWNLLGFENDHPTAIPAKGSAQTVPTIHSPDNRSELKALDARIRQGEAMLRYARSDSLPTVDSYGKYTIEHGTVLGESGDSWQAGLRLDYSLYNGKRTEARIAASQAELAVLQSKKQRLQLELSLDIQQAEIQYQQSLERLQVTDKMVQVAKRSAELSRARFQEGLLLVSDLIDFEMRLTDAKARRASARANNHIAIANLRRAVGADQFPATITQ